MTRDGSRPERRAAGGTRQSAGVLLIAAGVLLGILYTALALREMTALAAMFGEQSAAVGRRVLIPGLVGFNLLAVTMVVFGAFMIRSARRQSDVVEVRPARPEEHQDVADLTVRAYEAGLGEDLSLTYAAMLRQVSDRAATGEVLVAQRGDALLGAVTYVPGPGPWAEFDEDDAAGIRMLAVEPTAQGGGIGARLVEACLERARSTGRSRLVLHTIAPETSAQRLYGRLGFARATERDFVVESGLRLHGWVLELR